MDEIYLLLFELRVRITNYKRCFKQLKDSSLLDERAWAAMAATSRLAQGSKHDSQLESQTPLASGDCGRFVNRSNIPFPNAPNRQQKHVGKAEVGSSDSRFPGACQGRLGILIKTKLNWFKEAVHCVFNLWGNKCGGDIWQDRHMDYKYL
jgi:hypothetical protein